jgi:hypothetical protein
MTSAYVLGVVGAAFSLTLIFEMLRRRHLREKYAALWILVATAVAVGALFPGVLEATSDLLGVAIPSNLVFFLGGLVLLLAHVQLSYETGRLEDRTRVLAEQVALLRLELDEVRSQALRHGDDRGGTGLPRVP